MIRLTALLAATGLSICLIAPATADTSGKKIALSPYRRMPSTEP
jgi:hypothetical protein